VKKLKAGKKVLAFLIYFGLKQKAEKLDKLK